MASCATCSSFDPYNEYCKYHHRDTSPDSWCQQADYNGSHIDDDPEKVCSTCTSFDPNTRGGWCDYHNCETNRDGYCKSYT